MIEVARDMKCLNLEVVQENFEQVFNDILLSGEPVQITREAGNAILVSEKILRGMTETLHLLSNPGMRESVCSGMHEQIADTATDLDW